MNTIKFFDASGSEIGSVERSSCKRFSMQAAADHRAMDAFKAKNPSVESALIERGSLRFKFAFGRSQFVAADGRQRHDSSI